jgi:hypothetical protein
MWVKHQQDFFWPEIQISPHKIPSVNFPPLIVFLVFREEEDEVKDALFA